MTNARVIGYEEENVDICPSQLRLPKTGSCSLCCSLDHTICMYVCVCVE